MSNVARHRVQGHLLVKVGAVLVPVVVGTSLITLRLVDSGHLPSITDSGAGTGRAALVGTSTLFTVSGTATEPISPGVDTPLNLRLTNPHEVPMSVTAIGVKVQKVSAPNANYAHPCAVGDFTVGQAASGIKITVAARTTSTLSSLGLPRATWPTVGMLDRPANQDGCKGSSLTLGYVASAELAQ